MTTSIRPYPDYQDSGLPWLGRIPAHWQVRRNGSLFAQRNETGYGQLPILEVSFNTGVRVRGFEGSSRKQVMSDREKYKRAVRGDIAYNMMRLWQGAVGVVPTDGLVSPAYVVARPYLGTVSAYFVELFRIDACKAEINKYSRGIVSDRNRLYWDEFKQMPVCVPPSEEQAAIVCYLNHADQKIRRFIQAKRRVIGLLDEQKQAIINGFISHGINPDAPFKPSGVGWIGDIPEHWELTRFGRLFTQRNETGFAELPILEVSLKTGVRVRDFTDGARKQQMAEREKYKRARQGDLAYNMMRMWQGAVGVAPVDGLVSPAYVVAEPIAEIDVQYYNALFHTAAYMAEVDNFSRGIVKDRNRLYWQDFKQINSPILPLAEQRQIVEQIEITTTSINQAIGRIESEIALVREYRTRLISDVVTGKLDVREATERLPSLVEEVVLDDDLLGLSIPDSEETDDLDDDPELLPVNADED